MVSSFWPAPVCPSWEWSDRLLVVQTHWTPSLWLHLNETTTNHQTTWWGQHQLLDFKHLPTCADRKNAIHASSQAILECNDTLIIFLLVLLILIPTAQSSLFYLSSVTEPKQTRLSSLKLFHKHAHAFSKCRAHSRSALLAQCQWILQQWEKAVPR